MKKSGKILVTGSTGFLGKRLCQILNEKGFTLLQHSSSVSNICSSSPFSIYDTEEIHTVFHLAGKTFVPDSWIDPVSFFESNVLGTLNVLEFCRKKRCSIIYASAYVYGTEVSNPIAETQLPVPNNPYASSKKMAEDACLYYQKHHGVESAIIRPFNIYGPNQNEQFLIPFLIKQFHEKNEIKVKDLSPKRDYIFIDDVVYALIAAMENNVSGIFNVGSGISFSVEELIVMMNKITKKNLRYFSENTIRPNEISDTVADISKAKQLLNWSPRFSIESGLGVLLNESGL